MKPCSLVVLTAIVLSMGACSSTASRQADSTDEECASHNDCKVRASAAITESIRTGSFNAILSPLDQDMQLSPDATYDIEIASVSQEQGAVLVIFYVKGVMRDGRIPIQYVVQFSAQGEMTSVYCQGKAVP